MKRWKDVPPEISGQKKRGAGKCLALILVLGLGIAACASSQGQKDQGGQAGLTSEPVSSQRSESSSAQQSSQKATVEKV